MEHTVEDYLKVLRNSFAIRQSELGPMYTKEALLADEVFGIVTYEYCLLSKMVREFVVCCCKVSEDKSYDDEIYLRTLNYQFFKDNIEYTRGICGAYWWPSAYTLDGSGLFYEDEPLFELEFDLKLLTEAMVCFLEEK